MFLFLVLSLIVIFLILFIGFMAGTFGAGILIIFGDVFVCIFLIIWIIKKIFFDKKDKKD